MAASGLACGHRVASRSCCITGRTSELRCGRPRSAHGGPRLVAASIATTIVAVAACFRQPAFSWGTNGAGATSLAVRRSFALGGARGGSGEIKHRSPLVAASLPVTAEHPPSDVTVSVSAAKEELLATIRRMSDGEEESASSAAKMNDVIEALTQSSGGNRFDKNLVDGEWALVFTRNADGSPALQKLAKTKPGNTFANFEVARGKFENLAEFFGGAAVLSATVDFEEDGGNPARISCDITDAGLLLGSSFRIPLPLRASGGWLDFLYLDSEVRVTRGNQGGVFVHVRPDKLQEVLGG
mmetsp:Transcript_86803/g.218510  ORF Transcript_86803/g.218510 Transcript_86803/m.218510 type:complete len:298 (+) Transcript_86803:99-992(+)